MPKIALRKGHWSALVEDQKIEEQESAGALPSGQPGTSGYSMRYLRGGAASGLTQGQC